MKILQGSTIFVCRGWNSWSRCQWGVISLRLSVVQKPISLLRLPDAVAHDYSPFCFTMSCHGIFLHEWKPTPPQLTAALNAAFRPMGWALYVLNDRPRVSFKFHSSPEAALLSRISPLFHFRSTISPTLGNHISDASKRQSDVLFSRIDFTPLIALNQDQNKQRKQNIMAECVEDAISRFILCLKTSPFSEQSTSGKQRCNELNQNKSNSNRNFSQHIMKKRNTQAFQGSFLKFNFIVKII